MIIKTISMLIAQTLKTNRKWWFVGDLEDYVHARCIHNASSVSRVARRMYKDDLIEHQEVQKNGRGAQLVQYRAKKK